MKVLLDECLPKRLKRELPGHDVTRVQEMGWAGIKNGGFNTFDTSCQIRGIRDD
jgi:hypothetical protein